ncbi:MAG TPA: AAA family ATPase [Actinomycetota bacterium]|nr:AAA family ATPase [Actinomycetota bacterium]
MAPPLLGRQHETRALASLLDALRAGRGGAVVVEGPAGIGKSRLLAEAARMAHEAGMLVAAGRADEMEALVPLAPLLSALAAGPSPILRREELRALERPGDQRFWLLEELAELLEVRSRDTPVLITIDDVEWADPATIWAVQSLSERLASSPAGWVLAARPDVSAAGANRLLDRLAAAGAARIELAPLDPPDVKALAAGVTGGTPDSGLTSFLDGAGGNPLLALVLLQALVADDAIRVEDGVASLIAPLVPDRFRATVRGRLGSLSLAALHFLQAASVFGRSFTVADVAEVLGSRPGALVPLVDETIRANVIVDEGGRLDFRHDLIRQAIGADVSPSALVALHRAAAAAIVSRNGPAAEAAAHLLESAVPGDGEAVAVLQRAAAETAGQAPRTAAELALGAIQLMSPEQPGWPEALAGTVRLAAWGSRFPEAMALADRALALELDSESAGVVRLGLSDALMLGGRRREVILQCREALARPDLSPWLRANFLHNLGFALAMEGEVSAATHAYREGIDCAGPKDEGVILACRIGIGFVTASGGHLAQALAIAEECARTAERGSTEVRQRFPQALLVGVLSAMDRFVDADAVLATYRKEAEELGASWALEFCERCACSSRMMAGRLGEAAVEAEVTLALIEALDMWHDSNLPLGVLALVSIHRNELEVAEEHVARSRGYRDLYGRTLPAYLSLAEALLRDARGDPAGAVAALEEIFDLPELLRQNLSRDPTFAPELVRLAQRAGDPSRAGVVIAAADELARLNPGFGAFAAAAAHCRGLASGDVERLVGAAEKFRDSPRVIARASAFEDAGRALLAREADSNGARYLNEALESFHHVGAVRDEARVRRRLRRAGIHPLVQRVASSARPKLGWEAVSSAELRVVRLVAQGLTNRQVAERLYLSTYTVGTHLKHVFDKVGITSRVELTRLAVERGLGT